MMNFDSDQPTNEGAGEKTRNAEAGAVILSIAPEWMDVLKELAIQPRTVSELQCRLNLAQSTVSNRLLDLREAGLVTYSRMGHANLYRLVPEAITRTAEDIKAAAYQIENLVAKRKARRARRIPQRIA